MKEVTLKNEEKTTLIKNDTLAALFTHIALAVIGFVASRSVVLGSLMPFGLSFAAGCSLTYLPSVTIGAFISYFFPAGAVGGFRYIACLLAIAAIRLMLSRYKRISNNPLFLGFICAV